LEKRSQIGWGAVTHDTGGVAGEDSSVIGALLRVPAFARLNESQAALLAASSTRRPVNAGEIVFREGEPSDGLHVVLAGRLRIYKDADDETEVDLSTAGAGDSYGEMALLDGGERSANVVALEPSEILVLQRDAFLRLLSESPALLESVMSQLTRAVRDTSGRLLREELEQRAVKAEMEAEKYRALAEMVAGVAHEINTPLGTVNTAVSIIRQRLEQPFFRAAAETSEEAKFAFEDLVEALGLMDRNIQRAHKLIENFKKLSVSQISDTLEALNLLEIIDETVQLFSVNARQAGLTVEIKSELPDRAAAAWTGYRGFMSQVLLNLFTNAERYAYPGGVGGRIEITVGAIADKSGEARFTVQVRDFGCGMSAEVIARIFEPFFTTGRSIGGSGLGLSIVKNLVTNSLKGTIGVQSVPAQGTTFSLVLPRTITD
jgi:signal transduction histidine kinase